MYFIAEVHLTEARMTSKFGLLVGNRKHSSHVKEQKVEQRDKRHNRKLEREEWRMDFGPLKRLLKYTGFWTTEAEAETLCIDLCIFLQILMFLFCIDLYV